MESKVNRLTNKMNKRASGLVCSALLLLASGCATSVTPNPIQGDPSTASSPNPSSAESVVGLQFQDEDSPALEKLWKALIC